MRTKYFGFSEYFESCFKAEQYGPAVHVTHSIGTPSPLPQLSAVCLLEGLPWEASSCDFCLTAFGADWAIY